MPKKKKPKPTNVTIPPGTKVTVLPPGKAIGADDLTAQSIYPNRKEAWPWEGTQNLTWEYERRMKRGRLSHADVAHNVPASRRAKRLKGKLKILAPLMLGLDYLMKDKRD